MLSLFLFSQSRLWCPSQIPMGLEQNGDIGVLPLHRDFVWDVRFIFFGALWWLALFWVIEAMTAFAHFVISYTATVWYFSPPEGADERDVGWFPPLVAIGLGSIHHLGSFAVGGLVMGVTRPIRLLFPWAATKHLASTEDSPVVQSLRNSFREHCCLFMHSEVLLLLRPHHVIRSRQ